LQSCISYSTGFDSRSMSLLFPVGVPKIHPGHTLLMDTMVLAFLRVPREESSGDVNFPPRMQSWQMKVISDFWDQPKVVSYSEKGHLKTMRERHNVHHSRSRCWCVCGVSPKTFHRNIMEES